MLYKKYLAGCDGVLFQKDESFSLNCSWMNSIVIQPELYGRTRDDLVTYLGEKNIETRLVFNGMHRQKALVKYGCDCNADYPVTDWLSKNGLYLPSGSGLNEQDIAYICELIHLFRKRKTK
jgi:perosamine synthetase